MEELLTAVQVAERLGVSRTHVTRLANSEVLMPKAKAPGIRGAFLFDPHDVEDLARERAKPKAQA